MNKTELRTLAAKVKRYLSITFLVTLTVVLLYGYLHRPEFPSRMVLRQDFIPGQWIYIVQAPRDSDEPRILRFYVNGGDMNDDVMRARVSKTPPFLVSDTDVKDVVIQRVANGLHIKLKGAVSTYQSDLYLEDGDTFTTYRVSLEQVDSRPPVPSGR